MPFHVYILKSQSTGRFYVGQTENLIKRIFEHNNNRTPSIKNRGPRALLHSEEYASRAEAVRRARQIKRMKSHKCIEKVAGASR